MVLFSELGLKIKITWNSLLLRTNELKQQMIEKGGLPRSDLALASTIAENQAVREAFDPKQYSRLR